MYIGIKTKAIYWNQKTQKVVSKCSEIGQDAEEINNTLEEKKNKIFKIIIDYKRQNNITPSIEEVGKLFKLEGTKILEAKEVKKELEDWIQTKMKLVKYVKIFNTVLYDLKELNPNPLYYRD